MRYSPSRFVFAAVLALSCATPLFADNAAGSERLKYLPKDYWFAGELDCRIILQMLSLPQVQQNPQFEQLKQGLQLVENMTGIDVEKEVEWLTLFAAGKGEKPAPLLVVQGKFDNAKVEKHVANSTTEKTYKKHKVYESDDFAVCFPEGSTILVGDQELIHEAIDGLGDKKRSLPPALKGVLERTPGDHLVWAAVRPSALLEQPALAEWRSTSSDLASAFKKIECLSLAFDMADDGIQLKGIGYADSADVAKSAYKYFSDRKRDLLFKEGTNVVFASLLIFSELKQDGQYVEGSFRLTASAMKELWDTKFIVRPGQGGAKGR